MYKLYYSPGACSMAVHAILNEIGQECDYVKTGIGATVSPEFLKLNPQGKVPVLVDNDFMMREGGAMIIYLCDKHKSDLLPATGTARANALQWLMYCNATLHPLYANAFWLNGCEKKKTIDMMMNTTMSKIQKCWDEIESHLTDKPYLCGENITAADFLMTVIANWNAYFTQTLTLGENTRKTLLSVASRPSFKAALASEDVTYKAAA